MEIEMKKEIIHVDELKLLEWCTPLNMERIKRQCELYKAEYVTVLSCGSDKWVYIKDGTRYIFPYNLDYRVINYLTEQDPLINYEITRSYDNTIIVQIEPPHITNDINTDNKTFMIQEVTSNYIQFDDGRKITYSHEQDCCECNYADFKAIDDLSYNIAFNQPLRFQKVDGAGFRFGNYTYMVFVPCYSEQNGYYDDTVTIIYDGKEVLNPHCNLSIY